MNNYFFGFRVINLTAKTHLLFAAFYLILGLQQLIAIQFLDTPRRWFTFYVMLIATMFAGAWATAHIPIIKRKEARQALEYDPGSRAFNGSFILAVALLLAWYFIPGTATEWFQAVALTLIAYCVVIQFVKVWYIRRFKMWL
jgi:hypothetical protein